MTQKILETLGEIQSSISELAANQKNNYRAIQENSKLLKEQGNTLSRLTTTVEIHEQRSTNYELDLKGTKLRFHEDMEDLKKEIKPIKSHVDQINGAGKLVRWIAIISGAGLSAFGLIAAIKKFF